MTISYEWLSDYLPQIIEPEKLSRILTSIGLEVESLEKHESIPGGLEGLVIGEVMTCEKHPGADKLSVTTVQSGGSNVLQIVCGAANVVVGQKVIVAPIGSTIYPVNGTPITMKKAKIRGVDSEGMICAEDEIGLGNSHEGIMVLNNSAPIGGKAADYFKLYSDWRYEIGLTPNRMDAMSHLGVARDVCAYLVHHDKVNAVPKSPFKLGGIQPEIAEPSIFKVVIENEQACQRYCGQLITGIKVGPSPDWLKNRLGAIGVRSINNIVDVTNYILHESGQPLHAFDATAISDGIVRVMGLADGTLFTTLDGKERKLSANDLMICNKDAQPMCIAGVFGGLQSGVTDNTTSIFLESAWFHPVNIRKTSVLHGLRTDAATRFEKGVDISLTPLVLKRAAQLIVDIAGGEMSGTMIDVYPHPIDKTQVTIKYHYLKKLSGKNYHPDAVKKILEALGFELLREGQDDIWFSVPYHKPDISLPADIVEEIMRIDGLDNIEIPATISMTPSPDSNGLSERWQEKVGDYLASLGFNEIFTNSITNSAYYNDAVLASSVKMMNNLSVELDILRPSMLETGLESIAHNINRKNKNLLLFEFGKTYGQQNNTYSEEKHLALLISGNRWESGWRTKEQPADFFYLKGIVENILRLCNCTELRTEVVTDAGQTTIQWLFKQKCIATLQQIHKNKLQAFDIRQTVYFADLYWDELAAIALDATIKYQEIARFPSVERDIAVVLDANVAYSELEHAIAAAKITRLKEVRLFDVFESDKLGANKKSLALNFLFQDEEKTLTDKEVESMMQQLIKRFETLPGAEIRK